MSKTATFYGNNSFLLYSKSVLQGQRLAGPLSILLHT